MYPHTYTVTVWNELDSVEEKKYGVTFAPTYLNAMAKISNYYGDDDIIDVFITALEKSDVIELNEDTIRILNSHL